MLTMAYLTSSPAKSNTLVMVTVAGSDALVSGLKGATFNSEEPSWGLKQENQSRERQRRQTNTENTTGLIINALYAT